MIYEYHNFLTQQECDILISIGESQELKPGTTSGKLLGYRKAKAVWFSLTDLVLDIKSRIADITGIPIENQENFHFVKYEQNGEYKSHFDGVERCKTALIYLNKGYVGGETYFNKLDKKILPEVGKLVVWDNILSDGSNDPDSLHSGLPVEFGTKYIGVIWIKK